MVPVLTQLLHRVARSANGAIPTNSHPSVPDGNDSHDQRLALDNSRAGPSPYIGLGGDGTLNVKPELVQLLGLTSAVLDLDEPAAPVFAPSIVTRPVAPAVFHHDIPSDSRRFLGMNVLELLEEVMQRAVGEGPADEVRNPGVTPEHQRLGAMAFALQLTPGRQHDALILRNAGMALNTLFYDFASLLEEMRIKRPDLAPVVPRWRTEITRAAILRAVAVPLGADGQPHYVPQLYDPVVMPLRQPFGSYLPLLEWRLGEHQRHMFLAHSRQFFASLSVPIVLESPRENRVLGAAGNELEGHDLRDLLDGKLVFRCAEDELAENLRTVPAGKIADGFSTNPRWSGFGGGITVEGFLYPDRASGTTIKKVEWQDKTGLTRPVFVANTEGVHSFTIDWGRTWRATGGHSSAAFDDLRADAWRKFLADRWHLHKAAARAAMPDIGGR